MVDHLKLYRKKLDAGEIERPLVMTPDEKAKSNPKSLRLAINAKCFDCCGKDKREVGRCEMTDCSLWSMRPWQPKEAKN